MDNFCKLTPADIKPYFETAAIAAGFPIGIIEKDFWVCWTLRRLFSLPDIGPHLIFKGGTTLSKVYAVIERFSEDIDISIDRTTFGFIGDKDPEMAGSGKKQQQLIEELVDACRKFVQTRLLENLRSAMGGTLGRTSGWDLVTDEDDSDGQTLLFHYPAVDGSPGGYIRPSVKIEMGARSDNWPAHRQAVTPYLATHLPGLVKDTAVDVKVLDAARTFWEKATILHMYAHWPEGRAVTARQSRHYYDLFRLILSPHKAEALAQPELLKRVAEHKRIYFRAGWAKYHEALPGSLRLVPTPVVEGEMQRDYTQMQEMIFGEPPAWGDIMAAIRDLEIEVNR